MKTSRMERIRKSYGVPAKRGGKILFHHNGRVGRITSVTESQRLRVLFDGDKKSQPVHPTWKVEYLPANAKGMARRPNESRASNNQNEINP